MSFEVISSTPLGWLWATIIFDAFEKLNDMTEEDIYELLASDGMLIKRPLFISNKIILKGFKENEWEKIKGE